jgi:hypothetical protein
VIEIDVSPFPSKRDEKKPPEIERRCIRPQIIITTRIIEPMMARIFASIIVPAPFWFVSDMAGIFT